MVTHLSAKLQLREASWGQEARCELNAALTKQSFEDIGMTKLELGHEDEKNIAEKRFPLYFVAMSIQEKYSVIVNQLNTYIEDFNLFLSNDYKFKQIAAEDTSTYSDITNCEWDDHKWPSQSSAGVYILCGYNEKDPSRLGAYIGKTSLQTIGHRIAAHFNPYRSTGVFKKSSGSNETYIIEVILAVPVKIPALNVIAQALEEYFIIEGFNASDAYLLNKTANK